MNRPEDIPEKVRAEASAHMRRVGWYDERHIAETSRAILAAEKRVRKECEKFAEMEAARLNSITAISRDEDAIRLADGGIAAAENIAAAIRKGGEDA